MRRVSIRAVLAALLVACSAGERSTGDANAFPPEPLATIPSDSGMLRIAVRTSPSQPPQRGTCAIELTVTDASNAPKDGLVIDAVPWMPAHGHGGSTKPGVDDAGGGKYVVHDVSFFMPGEWQLRLTFSGPLTDHAAATFTVP